MGHMWSSRAGRWHCREVSFRLCETTSLQRTVASMMLLVAALNFGSLRQKPRVERRDECVPMVLRIGSITYFSRRFSPCTRQTLSSMSHGAFLHAGMHAWLMKSLVVCARSQIRGAWCVFFGVGTGSYVVQDAGLKRYGGGTLGIQQPWVCTHSARNCARVRDVWTCFFFLAYHTHTTDVRDSFQGISLSHLWIQSRTTTC